MAQHSGGRGSHQILAAHCTDDGNAGQTSRCTKTACRVFSACSKREADRNGLPETLDAGGFSHWRSDPDKWIPVVRDIASKEGIDVECLTSFKTGMNLVVDLNGSEVLKLFPPIYAAQFMSERSALRLLIGRLSVPVPEIRAEGQNGGWSWLISTKLSGTVGSEVWPLLTEDERGHVIGQIGQSIAEVQAVAPKELATMEPTWPQFLSRQTQNCIERHRRQGLAAHLLEDLAALLIDAPNVLPKDVRPVILTGEWIPENLLLNQTSEGWRLAAVIDFGDVMTGWGEYDLLGPSTFMCAGVPSHLKRLLEGYGVTAPEYDAAMRQRLLTLMLLHRASDLRKINIAGWENSIERLQDLQNLIWPEISLGT